MPPKYTYLTMEHRFLRELLIIFILKPRGNSFSMYLRFLDTKFQKASILGI